MSDPDDSSIGDPVAAVEKEHTARLKRMLIGFAVVEGGLLAIAVVLVCVLKLVDPDTGRLVLFGIVLLGVSAFNMLLGRHVRASSRAVARARAENPLF